MLCTYPSVSWCMICFLLLIICGYSQKELKQLKEAGEKAMYQELLGSPKHAVHESGMDEESDDSDDSADLLSMIQEKQVSF